MKARLPDFSFPWPQHAENRCKHRNVCGCITRKTCVEIGTHTTMPHFAMTDGIGELPKANCYPKAPLQNIPVCGQSGKKTVEVRIRPRAQQAIVQRD
ncbi:hypothetical protein CBM2586_A10260 [Cupriavidus phytorum]|uniref:Uncharacterized protein n=1 Tax=Cupriavidus taiwanensis TaxID=164546 RepID=A0A975ZVK7_9BURK|nr:hypothetical protein CBM2586_A10260 [Cupriavidus taiwanensis]